jgi:hypothetical protein
VGITAKSNDRQEEEMAKTLRALMVAVVLASGATTTAGAQPPTTTTEHTTLSYAAPAEACNGELTLVTADESFVFHTTAFGDGRVHIHGTSRQDFSWTQNGVSYTARAVSKFNQNLNAHGAFNNSFAINGQGFGSDGSRVTIQGVIHLTIDANGVITVDRGGVFVDCQ